MMKDVMSNQIFMTRLARDKINLEETPNLSGNTRVCDERSRSIFSVTFRYLDPAVFVPLEGYVAYLEIPRDNDYRKGGHHSVEIGLGKARCSDDYTKYMFVNHGAVPKEKVMSHLEKEEGNMVFFASGKKGNEHKVATFGSIGNGVIAQYLAFAEREA